MVDNQSATQDAAIEEGQIVKLLTRVVAKRSWPGGKAATALDVAFQDDHWAVVVKPQGMATLGNGLGETAAQCVKHLPMPSLPGAPLSRLRACLHLVALLTHSAQS